MEQSCYKCGQVVDEGVAFCPHCSAPQIRVVISEPQLSIAISSDSTATLSDSASAPAAQTVPVLAVPMRWSEAVKPCALAAFIAAIVMVLKLVAPVIALPGAGLLAVSLYCRRNPGIAMRGGTGARLGAICGLFCSGLTAVLATLRIAILQEGGEIRKDMLEGIRQAGTYYPEPQAQQTLDFMRSPAGLMLMLVFLLVFGLLLFLFLGTLGGALGGAVFRRRDRN